MQYMTQGTTLTPAQPLPPENIIPNALPALHWTITDGGI